MLPKYRVWHKQQNKMYSVEIMYLGEGGGVEVFDKWVTDFLSGEKDMATKFFTFDDVELMQYTWLRDKNSIEVYEGDVIKVSAEYFERLWNIKRSDYIGAVWFDKELPSYQVGDLRDSVLFRSDIAKTYFEIIGNIYEHTSLIGEK